MSFLWSWLVASWLRRAAAAGTVFVAGATAALVTTSGGNELPGNAPARAEVAEVVVEKENPPRDDLRSDIAAMGAMERIAMWFAVLVLPGFIFWHALVRGLRRSSNVWNGTLVVFLALPAMLAAWILTAFGMGWTGLGLTLGACVASAAYAFIFLGRLEEWRRGRESP